MPTSFFKLTENKDDILLRGNAVLFAEELKISASSKINEVIICARKVTIEEGFTGSIQIFCSDTVLIYENVTLQYPSGIFVDAEIDRPYVSLSENSEINGYVIIKGKIRDEELLFPAYRQSENHCSEDFYMWMEPPIFVVKSRVLYILRIAFSHPIRMYMLAHCTTPVYCVMTILLIQFFYRVNIRGRK